MNFSKRVRFGEADAQGVLYHGRYLDYFDIGIQEYWRAASGGASIMVAAQGHFHVVHAEIDYLKPIIIDELIDIVTKVERIGRSSLTFDIELRNLEDGEIRARGIVVHVQVDAHQGRAMPLDDRNIAMIKALSQDCQT